MDVMSRGKIMMHINMMIELYSRQTLYYLAQHFHVRKKTSPYWNSNTWFDSFSTMLEGSQSYVLLVTTIWIGN